jgi:uncharacterized protein (DUF1778 family)
MYGKIPYMSTETPIANSRLELRISARDKQYVNRAAELQGEAVSSFARTVLVNEAKRIVESEQTATLSVAESRRFLKALERPFAPNAALRKAMAKGEKLGL